jgi:hypothetical protein
MKDRQLPQAVIDRSRSKSCVGTSDRPSFLRTTPAKKPRTECCCQPVAFMMATMVAPCRPCSMAITAACFDSARPALAGLRGASPVRHRSEINRIRSLGLDDLRTLWRTTFR